MGEGDYLYRKTVSVFNCAMSFLPLYMMRCNFLAIYVNYKEILGKHRTIVAVEKGMKETVETPENGHLSFTDDDNAMAIMFQRPQQRTICNLLQRGRPRPTAPMTCEC